MDGLKDLIPTLLLAAGTGFVTYVFGRQKYRRDKSTTELNEAQDSEQVVLMQTMREREQAAIQREREAQQAYLNAREELAKTREAMNGELQSLRNMGDRRDMLLSRQGKQLAALARMLVSSRPELRDIVEESGFVMFDDVAPKRRTDPGALPGPLRIKKKDESDD